MAKLAFNPQTAEKREERGPMPAGEYLFSITESEIKAGKKPGVQILGLTYTCLADGYKGRKVWQYLNIVHPTSAEAQRIAQGELREICEAAGLGNQMLDDTVKLHNIPMLVRIKVEKEDGYDDKNRPTSWKPAGAATGAAPGGFKPPVAGQGAAGGFKAPVATPAPAQQQLAPAPEPEAAAAPAAEPAQQEAAAPVEPPAAAPAGKQPPWMKRA